VCCFSELITWGAGARVPVPTPHPPHPPYTHAHASHPPPFSSAGAVTSGELAHTHLRDRPDAWWRALGTRALHLTWSSRGPIPLDGLGLTVRPACGNII
jgi:hypothetical protein